MDAIEKGLPKADGYQVARPWLPGLSVDPCRIRELPPTSCCQVANLDPRQSAFIYPPVDLRLGGLLLPQVSLSYPPMFIQAVPMEALYPVLHGLDAICPLAPSGKNQQHAMTKSWPRPEISYLSKHVHYTG